MKYLLMKVELKIIKCVLSIRTESNFSEINVNFGTEFLWNIRLTNAKDRQYH